jgi:hypothetical protein
MTEITDNYGAQVYFILTAVSARHGDPKDPESVFILARFIPAITIPYCSPYLHMYHGFVAVAKGLCRIMILRDCLAGRLL